MEEATIKILEDQITKLDAKDFDLEAWKSSTVSLLARIFGNDDHRLQQIQELKIDYGSWALRDASSSYNPVKSCKKIGREILDTSISELKAFGVKKIESGVLSLIQEELTGAQLNQIKALLGSSKSDDDKKSEIQKILNSLSKGKSTAILTELLIEEE